jgi:Icc-related predicted phosphoesterase
MMKELHILACSDLHGSADALDMLEAALSADSYDLLVACGDFTTFGSTEYTQEFLRRIKIKVLAVPGNCDIPDTVAVLEQRDASIHNTRANVGGWQFFGFGGGLPTNMGMPFEIEESLIERSLRAVAVPEGIMVTHMPSYGMNDCGRSGKNAGSRGILRIAKEFKPVLALAGHYHESRGKIISKDTTFVNPGPAKKGFYASVRVGEVVEVEFHEVGRGAGESTMF